MDKLEGVCRGKREVLGRGAAPGRRHRRPATRDRDQRHKNKDSPRHLEANTKAESTDLVSIGVSPVEVGFYLRYAGWENGLDEDSQLRRHLPTSSTYTR